MHYCWSSKREEPVSPAPMPTQTCNSLLERRVSGVQLAVVVIHVTHLSKFL